MQTTVTNNVTSLEEVLAYRHPGAIRRYAKEHHVSLEEAEEVYCEMLKFLYLSYRAGIDDQDPFGCMVSSEIEKIDEMWHTFLLFTMDYADFCDWYFGFFLHHVPNDSDEESIEEAPVENNDLRTSLERQFALVYDILGEDTLVAWYDECRYAMNVNDLALASVN